MYEHICVGKVSSCANIFFHNISFIVISGYMHLGNFLTTFLFFILQDLMSLEVAGAFLLLRLGCCGPMPRLYPSEVASVGYYLKLFMY